MNAKTITFTFIFLFALQAFSQNTWFKPGAKWHYDFSSYWDGEGYETMEYFHDSTINTQTYQVLYGNLFYVKYYNTWPLTWDSIRATRQPRFVYQTGDTIWEVRWGDTIQLYNLSLGIGDTVRFMNFSFGFYSMVDDTSHTILNGQKLRTQNIGIYGDTAKYQEMHVIERIGAVNGPFSFFWYENPPLLIDNPVWGLNCYEADSFPKIKIDNEDCIEWPPLSGAIPENGGFYFDIVPNPVVDRARIRTNLRISEATLWTITGQQVFEYQAIRNGDEIDFSHLSKGMYLLKVNTREASYFVKIMK